MVKTLINNNNNFYVSGRKHFYPKCLSSVGGSAVNANYYLTCLFYIGAQLVLQYLSERREASPMPSTLG